LSDTGRRAWDADLGAQVLPDGEVGRVGAVEAAEEGGEALEPACAFEPFAPIAVCGQTLEVRTEVCGYIVREALELGEPGRGIGRVAGHARCVSGYLQLAQGTNGDPVVQVYALLKTKQQRCAKVLLRCLDGMFAILQTHAGSRCITMFHDCSQDSWQQCSQLRSRRRNKWSHVQSNGCYFRGIDQVVKPSVLTFSSGSFSAP
jgi:hypothetical protein